MLEWDWLDKALCAEPEYKHVHFDPDIQFTSLVRIAQGVCIKCPVRVECCQQAIDSREPTGVWGATTPYMRLQLSKRKDIPRAIRRFHHDLERDIGRKLYG